MHRAQSCSIIVQSWGGAIMLSLITNRKAFATGNVLELMLADESAFQFAVRFSSMGQSGGITRRGTWCCCGEVQGGNVPA